MARNSLAGRVALVTGAAQGMGASHARRLAADGAHVIVSDRVESAELTAIAAEISGTALAADMHIEADIAALIASIRHTCGRLDVVVANHAYMTMANFLDHDEDDWWRVINTNLSGTFHLIRHAVPLMRETGEGRVVIISSEWGVTGWPDATAYAASKAGLISLVKTLGRELGPEGLIVNGIAPGVTDTPQLQVDADAAGMTLAQVHDMYAADIPMKRIGRREELSAAVSLLADFRLKSMIGQIVQVNGGTTRSRA